MCPVRKKFKKVIFFLTIIIYPLDFDQSEFQRIEQQQQVIFLDSTGTLTTFIKFYMKKFK